MNKLLLIALVSMSFRACMPVSQTGYAAMQGRRPTMEDRHVMRSSFNGVKEDGFYAIFDGHGGIGMAEFAADFLPEQFIYYLKENSQLPGQAFKKAFARTDQSYYNKLKDALRQQAIEGSTAVCVYHQANRLYTAHVGDSRAVLSQAGTAHALTHDHKPQEPKERARIVQAGGHVTRHGRSVYRVNGILAVSRALGDYYLKKPVLDQNIISAEPDISRYTLTAQDEFIILACDGVWDVLSIQQAVTIVRDALKNHVSATQAAHILITHAYTAGSSDNISAIVLVFSNFS